MRIPGSNLAMVILLDELNLQCALAEASIGRLREAADAWVNRIQGKGKPLDIVSDCIVCLSATASISRLLEPGKREGKKHTITARRCSALREILSSPELAQIHATGTRNSWEHMDERLDVAFQNGFKSFSPVHLSTQQPSPDTFTHYHFDPVAMTIKHGADSLNLDRLEEECHRLRDAASNAMLKLHTEVQSPYATDDE